VDYVPDMWPDQGKHHALARQVSNPQLREALLVYQYPYTTAELLADKNYSAAIKLQILALDKDG